jgi:hypothetical protein
MAILIVGRTLLRVGQNLVGFFRFFKFGFRFFITGIAVRVMFHRQALVSLFDFTLVSRFGDA